MKLPRGIEKELLDYLHREYGEIRGRKGALKSEDLVYAGEFEHEGVPAHFWSVGRRKELWAIVTPHGKSYGLATTTDAPTPRPKVDPYGFLRLQDATGDVDLDIPLQKLGKRFTGLPDYHPVKLPRGEKVGVLAEVHADQSPIWVVVSVEEGEKCLYARAFIGVDLVYTTNKGNELGISLGPIER